MLVRAHVWPSEILDLVQYDVGPSKSKSGFSEAGYYSPQDILQQVQTLNHAFQGLHRKWMLVTAA